MKNDKLECDIVAFASDVMRNFFEDNDFSSLITHLSPDVLISVKSGNFISNREDAIKTLELSRFFPCKTEQKDCRVKQLADNLYLTDYLATLTSSDFTGIRNVRVTLIINSANKSYEIAYLAFAQLADNSQSNVFPADKKLPRRERGAAREELLISFVLEGLNNKEMARRLSLAEITIKKALSKIYQRFGVKNKTELLAKITKK